EIAAISQILGVDNLDTCRNGVASRSLLVKIIDPPYPESRQKQEEVQKPSTARASDSVFVSQCSVKHRTCFSGCVAPKRASNSLVLFRKDWMFKKRAVVLATN